MWTFRAMNTDVAVAAPTLAPAAQEALARDVASAFEEAEQRFSRFRPDSELSRLNRDRGPTVVSPALLDALIAAHRHGIATGGLFDPAVGGALESAGYDRSFAPGRLDRDHDLTAPATAHFRDVAIDEATRTVRRPPHVRIDLGGIVKGRTVDRAAQLLPEVGVVDAGGDVVLRGNGPDGAGWRVDVEDPRDPRRVLITLVIADRAVATSAPNRRRWRAGGGWAHHLIDPRTGLPARSDLLQATAIARTAEDADVLAKVAFLLGAAAGTRFLEDRGAAGILVTAEGGVRRAGDIEVADA
jgi:thiamine biosynthesis lipoprotein